MVMVADGGGSRVVPAPPPPPPPPNKALQDNAVTRIEHNLDDSGLFNSVSRDEARDSVKALTELNSTDAGAVIDRLQADGKLVKLAKESVENQDGWFGPDGMSKDEQSTAFTALAQTLDGAHLATLSKAYKEAGGEHELRLADAVSRQSTPATALDYVRALAPQTTDGGKGGVMGGTYVDTDAKAIGTVISSLRGDYAAQAFASLSTDQRNAVLLSSTGLETAVIASEYTATEVADVHPEGFQSLMDAAATITDPAQRAAVLSAATDTVASVRGTMGVQDWQVAPLARATIHALDAASLTALGPDKVATLAEVAAKSDPDDLPQTLADVSRLAPSPARDALIRTLFLKTDAKAYEDHPALASAMGQAFARTQTSDTTRIAAMGDDYARFLGNGNGRAFVADSNINPSARLWAMGQVAANPATAAGLVRDQEKPWESAGVLELYAAARTQQFATARGDDSVVLKGGADFANFVGSGLGAPVRGDLPADLSAAQAGAANGSYDFYQGVDAVQKPADGIRNAQSDMGGGDVRVGVVPVQYSSQKTGPVDLQLYRVDGANGQSRYVDNTGRVYSDFAAWKGENDLPPGKMTYPADGHLATTGATVLETANTPKVSDTFWEHVRDVADVAALVGGVVASGVIIVGSGGTATPLVAGAWTVAIGSAAYTGVRAYGELSDRASHDQSLALTDPDARAAWISLAASGLTVAGAGATRIVGLAAEDSALAINGARAAGVLNTTANYADAAATANTAGALVQNWDRMTPAERAQMGLQIAFWGGMTGLSAKAGGGSVTDAFNFRAQINHAMLETGAATRVNPDLLPGEASVVATRDPMSGAITDLRVEYAPGTSKAVIDVHTDVARQMVTNSGAGGVMRRAFGDANAYTPGSRGEEVSLEVAKHEALLTAIDGRLAATDLTAADRAALSTDRDDISFELTGYRGELDAIKANRGLGNEPGLGNVDVKQSARVYLDTTGTAPKTARAALDFSQLRTGAAGAYPDARPVTVARNGTVTVTDDAGVTHTLRNFGPQTNTLRRFTDPIDRGGYGGQLFWDPKQKAVIVAVNMSGDVNPGLIDRVEVPFRLNGAGQWRADFSAQAPYSTSIPPAMVRDRRLHFEAANQNLYNAIQRDPALGTRLGIDTNVLIGADRFSPPPPYTWHHVDGSGGMELLDSGRHLFFMHVGGFNEWTGPAR